MGAKSDSVARLKFRTYIANKLLERVSLLYVQLDRRLREHIAHIVNSDYFLKDTLTAKIAYLLHVERRLRETISTLLKHMNVETNTKIELRSGASITQVVKHLLPRFMPRRLHPMISVVLNYNTPENMLFKCLLQDLASELDRILEQVNLRDPLTEPVIKRLVELRKFLYNVLSHTRLAEIDTLSQSNIERVKHQVEIRAKRGVTSRVCLRLISIYEELRKVGLSIARDTITHIQSLSTCRPAYIVNMYRLYEIYVLLLILRVLLKRMRYEGMLEGRYATYFTFSSENTRIYVAYNQRDELVVHSQLLTVKGLEDSKIADNVAYYLGIPDIVIRRCESSNPNMCKYVIVECKFRFSVSSIIESRYKVLGYLLEFDVPEAVLVFPRPRSHREYDVEAAYQHELINKAIREGVMLEYNSKLGKRLILACIDPEDDIEHNIAKMENVLSILKLV